ncbi:MAG: UvrB/UvrC motif-containing protein [Oscillospiraceae bacterium]|nr:UvrB/UvrC motif-containing protein [Oscillospiraceae bacterium]
MRCERCGNDRATICLKRVEDGKVSDFLICEDCARQEGLIGGEMGISLGKLITGLLSEPGFGGLSKLMGIKQGAPSVKCSVCGMDRATFQKIGKMGCANCYADFREFLTPLAKRIHGNSAHTGKLPANLFNEYRYEKEIKEVRASLAEAVKREEYERAAELRDRIKAMEGGMAESLRKASDRKGGDGVG